MPYVHIVTYLTSDVDSIRRDLAAGRTRDGAVTVVMRRAHGWWACDACGELFLYPITRQILANSFRALLGWVRYAIEEK